MTPTILALLLAAGLPVPPQASQLPPWYHWLFEAFRPAGGGSGTILTVTGVSPLLLVNSLAHSIASLTQYGKCVQDGTPTPDAPVDIMCNNGVLKYSANMANVNEQTARVGYYISASGAVLADSYNWFYQDFIPCKPNTTYTLSMSQPVYYVTISEYRTAEDSGFIVRKNGSTGSNTSLTITTGANTNFLRFGANVDRAPVPLEEVLAINWMLNLGGTAMDYQPYVEGGIYVGGTHPGQNLVDLTAVTDGYYYDQSGVYTAVSDARLTDYISVKAGQTYTVYVKAERVGTAANVRCNLFDSAKEWKSQSSFVVNSGASAVSTITPIESGFLRVSANYSGTGAKVDWSALQIVRGEYTLQEMPPYEPYTEISYQPEVLTISGKNRFDKATMGTKYAVYLFTDNVLSIRGDNSGFIIPIDPSTTYTVSTSSPLTIFRMATYSRVPASEEMVTPNNYKRQTNNNPMTFTATADDRFLFVQVNRTMFNEVLDTLQLEIGSTATDYEPYVTPQTVTVPMLLSVGDYKDAAELIQGIKTGKVGIKVFDGTETFTVSSSGAMITAISDVAVGAQNTPMNTHFALETSPTSIAVGTQRFGASGTVIYSANYYMKHTTITTVADFKAWLASEYANGTPVIVIYPRTNEQTEQTTPHSLHSYNGTTIVTAQTNVDPVELSVEYKGVVT